MRFYFNYIRSGLDFILKHSSLAHIKPRRILVPAFICPIVPEVIRRNGFEVKFADVDLESFNIKITDANLEGVGAVFICHTFGAKCEIPSCNVPVIEDCAHFLSKKREGDNEFFSEKQSNLEGRRSKTPSALFALYSMYKQVANVRGGYVECDEDLSGAYEHLFTDKIGVGDLPTFLLRTKGPHQPVFNFIRSLKRLPACDSVEEFDVLKASRFTMKMFERGGFDPAKKDIYSEMKLEKFFKMQHMPEGSVPFNFSVRVEENNEFCISKTAHNKGRSGLRDELLLKLRRKGVFADRMWYNADTGGCLNAEILARNVINLPLGLKSLVELKNAIS